MASNSADRLEKQIKRKQRRATVRTVFICVLVVLALYVASRFVMKARTITVDNRTEYSSSDLVCYCCDKLNGKYLLSLNKNGFSSKLEEAYPYVSKSDISFVFPSTVRLVITGTAAVISIPVDEGGYIITNRDMKVLEVTDILPEGTLEVAGFTVSEYKVGKVLDTDKNIETAVLTELLNRLEGVDLLPSVTSMDFSKKYNICFTLDGIIDVELGNSSDMQEKIGMLITILEKNDRETPAVINVRKSDEGRYRIKTAE